MQRRTRCICNIKCHSFRFHPLTLATPLFLPSLTKNTLCHLFWMGFNGDIYRIDLFASVINQQKQHTSFHSTCAILLLFGFHSKVTFDASVCQVTEKPTGRGRLLVAKVLLFGSALDQSVICQKGVRNDSAATSEPQSVWSTLK